MIKEKIREVLIRNFKSKAHLVRKLADHEDFVKQHLFDSFELIQIVILIEREYKIKIEVADIANEKLNSLEKIEQFVIVKTG